MAIIVPTVTVHGNNVLVRWSGITTSDVGEEVDVSSFRLITVQMLATGGGSLSVRGSNDPAIANWWLTLSPSGWSGGASNSFGQITDRFRWLQVVTNGTVTTGDVALWCVN